MTIIADIKREKAHYEDHVARHKCGALRKCPERAKLWQQWMKAAKNWGTEATDDQRQRDHYIRNVARAAK